MALVDGRRHHGGIRDSSVFGPGWTGCARPNETVEDGIVNPLGIELELADRLAGSHPRKGREGVRSHVRSGAGRPDR